MKNFNIRLKALRKEKRRTQDDVSKILGIKRATYSGYERGVIMPPYEKIKALAEYFEVSVERLMGEVLPLVAERPPTNVSKNIEELLWELKDLTLEAVIDGIVIDDESRSLLISSLESSLKTGRIMAKRTIL